MKGRCAPCRPPRAVQLRKEQPATPGLPTRLGALSNLDLQLLRIHQELGGHAKAARGHLQRWEGSDWEGEALGPQLGGGQGKLEGNQAVRPPW